MSAGLWLGVEHDREPTITDTAGALGVRATPVIVHLLEGHAEAALQLQLEFAGSEVTLHALAGFAWYL